MSLILDALKKVEREETAGKPGVVVVGSVPWGEPTPSFRRGRLALGAVLALGLVALGAWWLLHPARRGASAAATGFPAAPTGSPTAVSAPAPVDARLVAPAAGTRPAAVPAPRAPAPRPVSPPPGEPSGDAATRSVAAPAASAAADAAAPVPELRLAAISARDGEPVAIVNDRLVREGDSFDGVRIVRIGEAEVEVEFRGRRHVLRF